MASRKSRASRGRAKRSRSRRRPARASGGAVRVKGHTRNPRGPDQGKKAVHVKGYRRRSAR